MVDDLTAMSARDEPRDGRDPREVAWDHYWSEVYHSGSFRPGGFTRWALSFLRTADAPHVVDLGCGPGRDLCFLIEQGYVVTGVDCSSVAVSLAERALARLSLDVRAQSRVVRTELLTFLESQAPASIGAIHASATYQDLSNLDLTRLFPEVARVLVPGGMHLWSVRSDRHTGKARPETVPPNSPGLGYSVPLRFFSRSDVADLVASLFENVALEEVETAPGFFAYYVADRKPHS